MAVVGVTSQSTYREDMDEEWSEYARTRIATYVTVHRGMTGDSEEGKAIVGLVEPFFGKRVEDMVESTRENAKLRECRQEGINTHPNGFYYKRVVRVNALVDCTILREVNLAA